MLRTLLSSTLFVVAGLFGSAFAQGEPPLPGPTKIGDLYYFMNDRDKTATVTIPPKDAKHPEGRIVVPGLVGDNYSVMSIGSKAFEGNVGITEVFLPEGLQVVDASAFEGCTSLVRVVLPKSLQTINADAFKGCTANVQLVLQGEKSPALEGFVADEVENGTIWTPAGSEGTFELPKWGKLTIKGYNPAAEGLKFNADAPTSLKVNNETQLSIVDGKGTPHPVIWSVDAPERASIDQSGKLKTTGEGRVTVTSVSAVKGDSKATHEITIQGQGEQPGGGGTGEGGDGGSGTGEGGGTGSGTGTGEGGTGTGTGTGEPSQGGQTAVSTTHSDFRVGVDGRTIIVYGVGGLPVTLYGSHGQTIHSTPKASGQTYRITVTQPGLYVVRVASTTRKIIVR